MKILKNHRTTNEKFQYILFDEDEKTMSRIETTPEKVKSFCERHVIESISPLDAMPMLNYKELDFGEFFPLPF
jgi:hypothetical protein